MGLTVDSPTFFTPTSILISLFELFIFLKNKICFSKIYSFWSGESLTWIPSSTHTYAQPSITCGTSFFTRVVSFILLFAFNKMIQTCNGSSSYSVFNGGCKIFQIYHCIFINLFIVISTRYLPLDITFIDLFNIRYITMSMKCYELMTDTQSFNSKISLQVHYKLR